MRSFFQLFESLPPKEGERVTGKSRISKDIVSGVVDNVFDKSQVDSWVHTTKAPSVLIKKDDGEYDVISIDDIIKKPKSNWSSGRD